MSINLIKRNRERREGWHSPALPTLRDIGWEPSQSGLRRKFAKVHRSFLRVVPITWPRNCAKVRGERTGNDHPLFSHRIPFPFNRCLYRGRDSISKRARTIHRRNKFRFSDCIRWSRLLDHDKLDVFLLFFERREGERDCRWKVKSRNETIKMISPNNDRGINWCSPMILMMNIFGEFLQFYVVDICAFVWFVYKMGNIIMK